MMPVQRLLWTVIRWLPRSVQERIRAGRYLRALRADATDAEPELRVLSALVAPGDCCLDIGANFGLYAHQMSRMVGPAGRVFAFEPVPSTFALLVENLGRLGVTNVQAFPYAVSDRDARITMSIPAWDHGAPNYYMAHVNATSGEGEQVEVESRRIDSVLPATPSRVAVVKCDVEGHELAVLRGALGLIQRDQPAWMVEISGDPDDANSDAGRTAALLRTHGYTMYRYDGRGVYECRPGERSVNYLFLREESLTRLAVAGIPVA